VSTPREGRLIASHIARGGLGWTQLLTSLGKS
jgi:hypothetical protein